MRRGEIQERIDPKFIAYGGHQVIQAKNKNSLGELVLQEPDYGAAERAVPMLSPDDTKYIRITDYSEDGIEPNHEFVTAEFVDEKYLIEDEDILFARTVRKHFAKYSELEAEAQDYFGNSKPLIARFVALKLTQNEKDTGWAKFAELKSKIESLK